MEFLYALNSEHSFQDFFSISLKYFSIRSSGYLNIDMNAVKRFPHLKSVSNLFLRDLKPHC